MDQHVKLEIPFEAKALFRAANMLFTMAQDAGLQISRDGGATLQRTEQPAAEAGGAPHGAPSTPGPGTNGGSEQETPPDVDAEGLPWDGRIHSSSKGINQDGTWRKRKGVAKETVAQVEAELRSTVDVAPPAPQPQAAPAAPAPAPEPPADDAAPVTFADIMTRMMAEQVTQDRLNAALEAVGAGSLPEVSGSQEMTDALHRELFGDG